MVVQTSATRAPAAILSKLLHSSWIIFSTTLASFPPKSILSDFPIWTVALASLISLPLLLFDSLFNDNEFEIVAVVALKMGKFYEVVEQMRWEQKSSFNSLWTRTNSESKIGLGVMCAQFEGANYQTVGV